MPDRTNINFSVTLDRKPAPEGVARVRAIVGQYAPIELELHAARAGSSDEWSIGGWYCEGTPDEADHIADELHETFPHALEVRCWDDPKYEWLGTLTLYRRGEPEARTASCDANGTAVYTAAEVLERVEKAKADHEPDASIALAAVIEAVQQLSL